MQLSNDKSLRLVPFSPVGIIHFTAMSHLTLFQYTETYILVLVLEMLQSHNFYNVFMLLMFIEEQIKKTKKRRVERDYVMK